MSASQEWPLQLIVLPDDWYQHTLVFSIGNEAWPPAESRYACHVRDLGKALDTMRQAGFKVFDPLEFAKPFVGQEGLDDESVLGNVHGILASRAVVAVLDGMPCDDGTSWECGFAFGQGIPYIGIRTDFRTDFRTVGPEGAVNLMLGESWHGCIQDPGVELTLVLRRLLGPGPLLGER